MQTWTKRQTYIEWTYSMYSWSDSVRTYTLNEMCRSSAQSLLACVFELKLMDLSNGLPVSPMPTTTTHTHTHTHTHSTAQSVYIQTPPPCIDYIQKQKMMYLLLYFLQSGARVDEVEDPVGPALSQAAHPQLHLLQTR